MIFISILSLSNVSLAISLFFRNTTTILVPFDLEKPCWVQRYKVSADYLEDIGRDVAMLLFDISPSSFSYKHKALLKHVAPEFYGELKKQLVKDGEHYVSLQLSTNFKPTQITAYPDTREVEVKGALTSYMAGKKVRESLETVLLRFTQRGGLLLLEKVQTSNQPSVTNNQTKKGEI